jgi:hypothetical protein
MSKHPLRQTLYFGPKEGAYIHSSKSPGSHRSFSNLSQEELEDIVRKITSTFPNTFENLRGAAQHEDVAKILSYSPASGRRRFGEVEAIGPRGHVH